MSSEKWYWTEPFLFTGSAIVRSTHMHKGKPALVLDRSLFYPEGGGQLGDRGEVVCQGEIRAVDDTQIDEQGNIFLLLSEPFATDVVEQSIDMRVNEEWRRRQMSQHTGQHLLSRLLQDRYQAPTISARLGERFFSVDVDASVFTEEQIAQIEDGLNRLVLEDRPIRAWFPSSEELAQLSLRKQPSVEAQVRIIQVEGFDVTPCGGTHCVRTGQVGMVHIVSVEKYKQLTRLTVVAGLDAVRDFRQKERTLRQLFTSFSATTETVVAHVESLRTHDLALQTKIKERTIQLAQKEVIHVVLEPDARIVHLSLGEDDLEYARVLSKELAKYHGVTAMVSLPVSDGCFVVLDRAEKGPLDLGMILKEVLTLHGGKGGGGALHAEGKAGDPIYLEILKQRFS